jgi:hypothetical protein
LEESALAVAVRLASFVKNVLLHRRNTRIGDQELSVPVSFRLSAAEVQFGPPRK